MKIRTKILLSLSTLPIFLVILIVFSLNQRTSINELSESLETNFDLTILTEQIHRDIKDEGISLRNIVIFNDEQYIQKELATLEVEREEITRNISTLKSIVQSDNQQIAVAELERINQEFNQYSAQVIDLVKEGNKQEALELIGENSLTLHEEFFSIIKEITTKFEANMTGEFETVRSNFQKEQTITILVLSLFLIIIFLLLARTVWTITQRLTTVANLMRKVANGEADLNTQVEVDSTDEISEVAQAFNRMTSSLNTQMQKEQELTWAKSNIASITTSLTGTQQLETLAQTFLSKVVPTVGASHAVFYVKETMEEDPVYRLVGSYAFKERKHLTNTFRPGEGLIGQAVVEKSPIILTDVPEDYIRIRSGLGEATPVNVYVLPIQFEGEVKAVIEIASFRQFTDSEQQFLEDLIEDLGVILDSVMSRIRLAALLEESQALMEETQAQAEELQTQQDELRTTNEELEEQTQALKQSEEKLQSQQEELEEINADLEEKTKILEEQNKQFIRKNKEVEAAKMEIEEKAEQLALSSKYKSEFLANMSHELRTPLNSLLILSKLLADNKDGNLSEKQIEFSKTIYTSGNDLLAMINDILDLAKIESGKVEVQPSIVNINHLVQFVENSFKTMAELKGLDFAIKVNKHVPTTIYSDERKIQQILKNLLSNAFKFTEQGEVQVEIDVQLNEKNEQIISFTVKDTGIGIPKDKQKLIFEAFQQADGTTSRKYGGTGLGLSIARETALLLGGEIKVESDLGKGTNFTFNVGEYKGTKYPEKSSMKEIAVTTEVTEVENTTFDSHIDIHEEESEGLSQILIVDDDKTQRNSLMELIGDMDVVLKAVSSGYEAADQLKNNQFDCIILDLGLTDTTGFDLLELIKETEQTKNVKVIIYTGRELTAKEEMQLNRHAHTIIIKDEHSPSRLKEELKLFLGENQSEKLEADRIPMQIKKEYEILKGKHVLLVDDDVRNVFALSSILEQLDMKITFAENGKESIEALTEDPSINIVLMDIMMPEMDGYEAMRIIRSNPTFSTLPIIALTAKAMKEDREKCLAAGASDYIVKPIDPDQLVSLIKVWLYQSEGN